MSKYLCILLVMYSLSLPSSAFQEINISFQPVENQPYFVGQPEINIDAEEFTTVVLRMKSNKSSTARLFWASSYDPQMNEPKSLWFFLDKSKNFKEYIFNVKSQNPYWIGFIGQLLLYPEGGPEGIEIESAKAVPGNLITNVKSGWREFWGPRGRLIEGSTVNNMRALTLWGRPFNLYAYALILLSTLLSLAYYYSKSKDSLFSWQNCGKVTIITALGFWGLLSVSQLFSEYIQIKSDFNKYDFKTLDEKRAIAVEDFGKDFYSFLKFCQATLPERAKVKFLHSGPNGDYPEGRAKYFLFPLDFSSKDSDYLIVYYYGKDLNVIQKEHPDFRLLKKFNEKAYILWKK